MFKVAIIGRPNVGKSTLFNKLTGSKKALVDPRPGATRDRRDGTASYGDFEYTIVDTAGLEVAAAKSIEALMMAQTEKAIEEADVLLMVVDGREGLTAHDTHFIKKVRKSGKPVILVANKCEVRSVGQTAVAEFTRLGFGEPLLISAEHSVGIPVISEAIMEKAKKAGALKEKDEFDEEEAPTEDEEGGPIKIAIIGRPNVGKSTLLNQILGEERVVASPIAGTTRDAISVPFNFRGTEMELWDTAGMRRKSRIDDSLEQQSVYDSLRAIRFAHVVILVLDSELTLDKQDLILADHVIQEGRVLILALNKWDKIKEPQKVLRDIYDRLEKSLGQIRGLPSVPISALTGHHVEKLLRTTLEFYEKWNTRITTGSLNRWLEGVVEEHSPPMVKGRQVHLRYATQTKTRPPSFIVFSSNSAEMPESYLRYLRHSLQQSFDLGGIPIRLMLRTKKNPYVDEE